MKIKLDSKAYNQLKECFKIGQQTTNQTMGNYEEINLSQTRYLWDTLWAGLIVNNRSRLIFELHNYNNQPNEILLPENCNDDHIEAALRHIYSTLFP